MGPGSARKRSPSGMMGWTAPDGIAVPCWPVMSRANRGAVRDDYYHDWFGPCEECVPGSRDRCEGGGHGAAAVAACAGDAVLRQACPVRGGDGGVRRGAL